MFSFSSVESPSSSASDVDDLNNQAMMDQMDVAKDGSSLQVTGNPVIAARNRPKFVRLLNFVCILYYHFCSFPYHCENPI